MISRFILSKYQDRDFLSQRKALYLFILMLITAVGLIVLSYTFFLSSDNLKAINILINVGIQLFAIFILLKGRYKIAAYIFLISSFIGISAAIMGEPDGKAFYTMVSFLPYVILVAFLFANRIVATVFTLASFAVIVVYYFVMRGEGVDVGFLNEGLRGSMPPFVLVFAIVFLIVSTLNNALDKMKDVLEELKKLSMYLNASSESVNNAAQDLSQNSSEQSANVEEITTAMEEIGATIALNAENAQITNTIATETSIQAEEGGKAVEDTVNAMRNITEKIKLIEDIASQTNMLSINASIEAARVKEHGKGFAVVANEVRKLAEESRAAAKEISELTIESVEISMKAGDLIKIIVPNIQKTANLVQEIAVASEQQNVGVKQINIGLDQLNTVTQQNAASSEELASFASELFDNVEKINTIMVTIKSREDDVVNSTEN